MLNLSSFGSNPQVALEYFKELYELHNSYALALVP